ncbi:MAG: PKD domain-containing protein [Thermoplasmata archaeon]|nr:PKD domain-containing protein [Thermoplasmata archaeon]
MDDAAAGYDVLFGGVGGWIQEPNGSYTAGRHALNDTWIFVNGTWQNVTGTSGPAPPPGDGPALMTYDAGDRYVLLVVPGDVLSNRTWIFQAGVWTHLAVGGLTSGTEFPGGLTYDSTDGYAVATGLNLFRCGAFDDYVCEAGWTYSFDGTAWTNRTTGPQPATAGAYAGLGQVAFADDPNVGGALLFGAAVHRLGQWAQGTWVYSAGNWSDATGSGPSYPSSQNSSGAAYDPFLGGVILFGGAPASGPPPQNVTWLFKDGSWSVLSNLVGASPPALAAPSLCMDPGQQQLLLFGGSESPPFFGWEAFPPPGDQSWTLVGGASQYPSISSFTVLPPTVPLNSSTTLRVTATGGAVPLTFAYSGLPPGCASTDSSTLACTSTASGRFSVRVYANDTAGNLSVTATRLLVVEFLVSSFVASPTPVELGSASWASTRLTATVVGGVGPLAFEFVNLPPGCSTSDFSSLACTPAAAGSFVIQVYANDSAGNSASASTLLTVFTRLGANATATPNPVELGASVNFSSTSFGGTGIANCSFEWSFGDQDSSTSRNPSHAYSSPGNYTARVRVNDTEGGSTTIAILVAVYPEVSVVLAVSSREAGLNQPLSFSAAASGGAGPYSYVYTGLPPGCATRDSPSLTCAPTQLGTYAVSVSVQDSIHYAASSVVTVTVVSGSGQLPNGSPPAGGLLGLPGNEGPLVLAALFMAGLATAAIFGFVLGRRRSGGSIAKDAPAGASSPEVPVSPPR